MNWSIPEHAQQVYAQVSPYLFKRQNVVACGLGYKIRGEEETDELSLVVSVVRKVPKEQLPSTELIPQAVNGMLTDVVETGCLRALTPNPKERHRPAMPGISVGHHAITAGTFGLLVRRAAEVFILSNNHVLANCNDAKPGDAIWQPAPLDGGSADDRIATLAEFEPLDFGEKGAECKIAQVIANLVNAIAGVSGSSHRLQAVEQTPGHNRMDASLARIEDPSQVTAEILGIGAVKGSAAIGLGDRVQKSGRTTGVTEGIVKQINVTANVDYNGRTARFTDQIITSGMSNRGDSGSGILDMERRAVGLLFAGSGQVTLFTPLQRILDRFGVEVVTE
ncbi:MAG: hypothetical protein ACP5GX_08085 [Anaerolineae bacterium]